MLLVLTPIGTFGWSADQLPFTPQAIESIRGRNICEFEGTSFEGTGAYPDRNIRAVYEMDIRRLRGARGEW